MHAIVRIAMVAPAPLVGTLVSSLAIKQSEYAIAAIFLVVFYMVGYVFFRAASKNFNYRITEKGVRVIYWDDYPEIAAQSLYFLAGVYILVAIIAGLYMGPLAFAGAGGIGLAHAMGMQKISRNEKQRLITWEDFDRVTVCRKRNVLDWHCLYRIYFTDILSIEEFLEFANQHRGAPVEVIEDEPILYQ